MCPVFVKLCPQCFSNLFSKSRTSLLQKKRCRKAQGYACGKYLRSREPQRLTKILPGLSLFPFFAKFQSGVRAPSNKHALDPFRPHR